MIDKPRRTMIGLAAAAAAVTATLLGSGARSSGPPETARAIPDDAPVAPAPDFSASELNAYRQDLAGAMEVIRETAVLLEAPELADQAAQGLLLAMEMPDADIEVLRSSGAGFADLRDRVAQFRDQLAAEKSKDGAQATDSTCMDDPDFPQPDFQGGPTVRASTGLTYGALLALSAAEGAWTVLSQTCKQDAVVNCSACCVPADIVRLLITEAYNVINFFTGHVDTQQIKTTMDRLESLHDDVEVIAAGQAALLAKLDVALVKANELNEENERLRETNCELLRLLLLPLEKRESNDPNCPQSPLGWD